MAFCPKCGKEVPANATYCPSCGTSQSSPSLSLPQSSTGFFGNHPQLALYVDLAGAAIIFLAAISYLVGGNALAGGLGVVFAVVTAFFGLRAYQATAKQDKLVYGMICTIVGFIVMGAGGAQLGDYIVILGGFLMTIGGILLTTGK